MKMGVKSYKPLFYIVFSVLTFVAVYFFIGKWKKQNNIKVSTDWDCGLLIDKDRPYDISIFHRFLKSYNEPKSFVTITKQKKLNDALNVYRTKSDGIYVFAGNQYYLSSSEVDALFNFVESGNIAFVASAVMPEKLTNFLYQTGGSWEVSNEEVSAFNANFKHSTLSSKKFEFKHPYYTKPNVPFTYNVVETGRSKALYSDKYKYPHFAALTETNLGGTDFIRVPYGNGFFYIHFNPIVFSNYYLSKDTGSTYVDGVLAHFEYKNVIWDEASKYYKIDGLIDNSQKQSIFYYLLSKPPLKAALIIFGISVLAFLIFRTKRKQAIIPVISQRQNTSIEYTKTIGNYYFLESDIRQVAKQKMNLFLGFVRFHYKIRTTDTDQVLINAISQKSKIQVSFVTEIFKKFNLIDKVGAIGNKNLSEFDNLLNEFYSNTIYKYGK